MSQKPQSWTKLKPHLPVSTLMACLWQNTVRWQVPKDLQYSFCQLGGLNMPTQKSSEDPEPLKTEGWAASRKGKISEWVCSHSPLLTMWPGLNSGYDRKVNVNVKCQQNARSRLTGCLPFPPGRKYWRSTEWLQKWAEILEGKHSNPKRFWHC